MNKTKRIRNIHFFSLKNVSNEHFYAFWATLVDNIFLALKGFTDVIQIAYSFKSKNTQKVLSVIRIGNSALPKRPGS